jgi:glycosyltransferase involved in cell wall biosynthesis
VVATHAAAEGLEVADGGELALAGTAREFADRILALLAAPAMARAMAERARCFVHEKYAWPQIAAELEGEYRAALRRKGLLDA